VTVCGFRYQLNETGLVGDYVFGNRKEDLLMSSDISKHDEYDCEAVHKVAARLF
jgi:hypothetical protein